MPMPNNEMSIVDELRHYFYNGTMVVQLILANAAVFCVMSLLKLLSWLLQSTATYEFLLNKLMVPAKIGNLLWQPWSVLSYMFLHVGFFHILFNMLMLNLFGNILCDLLGNRRILPLYILGGLAGAASYIVLFQLLPVFQSELDSAYMLGASAAVMAVLGAAATLRPDYTILLMFVGAVKLRWIALFFVLIDLFMIPNSNPGGHIAHLGGILLGFAYIRQLQKGSDWSVGINRWFDRIASFWDRLKLGAARKPRMVYKNEKVNASGYLKSEQTDSRDKATASSTLPRVQRSKDQQERIDRILDKISQSGYDSLSTEEKAFLFYISDDEKDGR